MILDWIWRIVAGRGIAIGIGASILAMVLAWDHQRINRHRQEAVSSVVEKSNEVARKRNEKARKIRRSNPVTGAASRLRKLYGPGSD